MEYAENRIPGRGSGAFGPALGRADPGSLENFWIGREKMPMELIRASYC